jgi:hypothetical protein
MRLGSKAGAGLFWSNGTPLVIRFTWDAGLELFSLQPTVIKAAQVTTVATRLFIEKCPEWIEKRVVVVKHESGLCGNNPLFSSIMIFYKHKMKRAMQSCTSLRLLLWSPSFHRLQPRRFWMKFFPLVLSGHLRDFFTT